MFNLKNLSSVSSINFSRASGFLALFIIAASAIWLAKANAQNAPAGQAQTATPEVTALEPGKAIEREMAGGQSHAYHITLAEGQYLSIVIEQRGIDVAVRLLGPDGKQILEVNAEIRIQGREIVSHVAEKPGNYQVTLQAQQKNAAAGRYEIRITELHSATEIDRLLQEARKLQAESIRLWSAGKYEEALSLAEHAREIREKELGVEHSDFADSLNILALIHRAKGNYQKAEPLYHQALMIREKALGAEHPLVTQSLNNLGAFYRGKGDYAKAEQFYQRALTIREKVLGPKHGLVADSLNGLAILYNSKGDYVRAEQYYLRALTIAEEVFGPEHLLVAAILNNLGIIYHRDKGDYAKAEPFYQRSLTIHEKAYGLTHPVVADAVNDLASLYRDQGCLDKSEPLYQRSLVIRENVFGPKHSSVGESLNNLAILYRAKGDPVKAEELSKRALEIFEQTLGMKHPDIAAPLKNLANLLSDKGDHAKARTLYQRSLAISEEALGQEHPDVAALLNNLADCYIAEDNPVQATSLRLRAAAINEHNISLNLTTGSERQKLAYLAARSDESDRAVSLHVRSISSNVIARDLALTIILRRKGRVLDAMIDGLTGLRRHINPQDQALIDRLKETNSQLARLVLNGLQRIAPNEYQRQIKELEDKKEKLENDIGSRSAEFRQQLLPVTVATIKAEIPEQAALVEFYSYRPFNAKNIKEGRVGNQLRYVVYVLHHQGEPQWVELGEVAAIDRAVEKFRQALCQVQPGKLRCLPKPLGIVRARARVLDELVMRPVRRLIGKSRQVFISPDGALNLVPFTALVDQHKHYLAERYAFTYLTSGRDLLRLKIKNENGSTAALVLADPAFDSQHSTIASLQRDIKPAYNGPQSGILSFDFANAKFNSLAGTADEAKALKQLLPDATVLTGEQATEAALKQVSRPRLLHIATHGFFLPDLKMDVGEACTSTRVENPLVRSGLVLAGANLRNNGNEDGIFTALEAAWLDLRGTKLVVLSACNSGVGEIKNGDGVYGLRSAFALAGSETQVMSLWSVSDQGTKELMVEYYKRLLRGEGRGEALRQVQLQMLKNPKRSHPFYWASFIQSGEWANLDGKR